MKVRRRIGSNLKVSLISMRGKEGIPKGRLKRAEGRRTGLEGLEELSDLQIEGGVVAAVAVEGVFGADGAGLEEEAGGVEVAGEAGVVEGDGVPMVAGVDVDGAGVEEVAEVVEVAGV